MTPQRAFKIEGSVIALVQNRINVAALALTALVFSGSFTMTLYTTLHPDERGDFRREFLHIVAPLSLGVLASLASIACFLQSQQSDQGELEGIDSDASRERTSLFAWVRTSKWWFSLGQLFLYMALSQALSASLTEIVYGVSVGAAVLGAALGILACLVWWGFLFMGPIAFLRRMRAYQTDVERRALYVVYALMLAAIFSLSGEAYNVRGGGGFWRNAAEQLYQPLAWHTSW